MSTNRDTPPQRTADGGSDHGSGLEFLKHFLGTLPGIITAVAALITAIGGAVYGGTRIAADAPPQPTATVTITETANAPAPAGTGGSAATGTQPTPAVGDGPDLSTATPVQKTVDNYTPGPVQLGPSTYADGIRFSCSSVANASYGYTTLFYDVASYATFSALIGVPDDATNAAGNSATIKFFKDGTSTQLAQPITVTLGTPQQVRFSLQGAEQLEITCIAARSAANVTGDDLDVALAKATLTKTTLGN